MEIPGQISAENRQAGARSCLDAVGGMTTIVKAARARLCHKLSRRFRLQGYRLGPGQRPGRKNPMAQGRRRDQAEASRARRLHGRGRGRRPPAARSPLGCSRANIVFRARTPARPISATALKVRNRRVEFDEIPGKKSAKVRINHLTILIQHGWLRLAGGGGGPAGWAS
jgi:hypothetical protein